MRRPRPEPARNELRRAKETREPPDSGRGDASPHGSPGGERRTPVRVALVSHHVTLAVIGGHDGLFNAPFANQGYELPYASRKKVELEADGSETLKSLFDRAITELGVGIGHGERAADTLAFGAFYKPEDDGGLDNRRFLHLHDLTTVDEEGRAVWGRPYTAVTLNELLRAEGAGALDGDPLKPYLILQPPAGNGVLATWALLIVGLQILKTILATASDIEGGLQLQERLERRHDRVDRGERAVSEYYLRWGERGARPDNFSDLLYHSQTWSPEDLAALLDCPITSAEAILEAFGYARDEVGLWRLRGDEDAVFIAGATDEVIVAAGMPGTPEVEVKKRLEEFVSTDKRPPISSGEELLEFDQDGELDPGIEQPDNRPLTNADDDELLRRAEESGLALPYELIQIRCACSQPDCDARMEFERRDDRLRLRLLNTSDHFEIDADFIFRVAMDVSVDHEAGPHTP